MNAKRIESLVSLVEEKFDSKKGLLRFKPHPFYPVWTHSFFNSSLSHVFGKTFFYWRSRLFLKALRKFRFLKTLTQSFQARLPPDSVIFVRPDKKGLIVNSWSEQKVLKVFWEEKKQKHIQAEIENYLKIKGSSFQAHCPEILDHGMIEEGRWLLTSFSSNSRAYAAERNPSRAIFEDFHEHIMRPMLDFYKLFPLKEESLSSYLKEARNRAHGHPESDKLFDYIAKLSSSYKKEEASVLVKGRIHHELHDTNVLRSEVKISIIDWEGSAESLLLYDFFNFYEKLVFQESSEKKKLLFYLKNNGVKAPETLLKVSDSYSSSLEILKKNEKFVKNPKLLFLLYILEHVLFLFEKTGTNRLASVKNTENFVFSVFMKS